MAHPPTTSRSTMETSYCWTWDASIIAVSPPRELIEYLMLMPGLLLGIRQRKHLSVTKLIKAGKGGGGLTFL